MPATKHSRQHDYMRELVTSLGYEQLAVCAAYAAAEADGLIARISNVHNRSPEEYALALWRDGVKKGWLRSPGRPNSEA